MHAAHRCAEDQAQMVYGEALAEKLVVSGNHVVIVVLRELSMQPVAWLRRFPVTNAVGKNDVVAIRIEKLPGSEELPANCGWRNCCPEPAGRQAGFPSWDTDSARLPEKRSWPTGSLPTAGPEACSRRCTQT